MLDLILGKEIAFYVRRHRALVICALVLAALSSLFVVAPAYLLQPFVDECMKTGSDPASWKIPWFVRDPGSWFSWQRTQIVLIESISPDKLLIIISLVAFVAISLRSIALYFSSLSAAAFANRAVKSLRIDLFKKFASLPMSFYHSQKTGELIGRATADLTVLQVNISYILIGLTQQPLTALFFLIYLLIMNYKLTLLVFIIGPFIVGIIRFFGKKVKKRAVKVQDATAQVTSAYHETLLCLKVVQGFNAEEYETNSFRNYAAHLYKRVMNWRRWELGLAPIMDMTVFLMAPALLIAAKVYFHHSLGELLSMVYAFYRLYSPIKRLSRVNNSLKTLQGATKRVFAIMNVTPEIQEPPHAKILPQHKKSIEFNRVNFAYKPHEPVLKDINLKIEAGKMIAFVGSTGAGKSTFLDLIPRFYDVSGGSISIDSIDIRHATFESLRRQIGIVSQDIVLFNDTIANNIGYGMADKDMKKIIRAAKTANAHDFIMALSKGYDTIVGDQGSLLSGGQKQRIGIARAIVIDPSILILDEAASALDAESEHLVQQAIDNLRGELTVLIVAHRLSTITKADLIYVLEEGRILESGTLKELLKLNGRFRQLYDMQHKNGADN